MANQPQLTPISNSQQNDDDDGDYQSYSQRGGSDGGVEIVEVAGIGCSVRSITSMAMMPMLAGIVTQVLVVVHNKLILCLQHRITPREVQVHHSTLRSLQHRIMVLSTGLGLQRLNYTSGSWYGPGQCPGQLGLSKRAQACGPARQLAIFGQAGMAF